MLAGDMAPRLRMWVPDWLVLFRRATSPPPWVRSGHHPPGFKSAFLSHSLQDCVEHPHLLSAGSGGGSHPVVQVLSEFLVPKP